MWCDCILNSKQAASKCKIQFSNLLCKYLKLFENILLTSYFIYVSVFSIKNHELSILKQIQIILSYICSAGAYWDDKMWSTLVYKQFKYLVYLRFIVYDLITKRMLKLFNFLAYHGFLPQVYHFCAKGPRVNWEWFLHLFWTFVMEYTFKTKTKSP
jgi:hypothetical protein